MRSWPQKFDNFLVFYANLNFRTVRNQCSKHVHIGFGVDVTRDKSGFRVRVPGEMKCW